MDTNEITKHFHKEEKTKGCLTCPKCGGELDFQGEGELTRTEGDEGFFSTTCYCGDEPTEYDICCVYKGSYYVFSHML